MGARRNDITSQQRAQIAIAALNPDRAWGTIKRLAGAHDLSRQRIYELAAQAEQILTSQLQPPRPGPQPETKMILVNRDRLVRSTLVLTEVGASQREVEYCLSEILDIALSPGWVNSELAKLEEAAEQVNQQWQPAKGETLAADEIYSHGQPNLLVVGNDSLYIYALSRQAECDGETWACLLWESPACSLVSSDAGTGLAAGVKTAQQSPHQLDWDHLLRPLWGQAARLEQQAYAALQAVEERAVLFEQATTAKRLQQHLRQWEQLSQAAVEKVARCDAFEQIARAVDAWFALIDLQTGQLQEATTGISQLQALGEQLQGWSGRIYQKLGSHLKNWAAGLFRYQPVLAQALQSLQARYEPTAVAALARMWQLEANHKRRPGPFLDQERHHALWHHSLDQALAVLNPEQLWAAWTDLCHLLGRVWRGSMLAECVNSLLRPVLSRRKQTDQGCLELFRFLHNVRPFARGKRAGHSPAQLVGLELPDDPLTLLGLKPKVSI